MSWERIHLRLLFTGRYDYFTRPIPVSFGFSISSQSPVLTSQLENALVEIKNTIIGMFNQWRQSSTEHRCAPVQLRFLLETAVEFNVRVQDYVLQIAVFSSPHFSDAAFTERLLKCLGYTIRTAGGDMKTLAMLCFCILCAIDGEQADYLARGQN